MLSNFIVSRIQILKPPRGSDFSQSARRYFLNLALSLLQLPSFQITLCRGGGIKFRNSTAKRFRLIFHHKPAHLNVRLEHEIFSISVLFVLKTVTRKFKHAILRNVEAAVSLAMSNNRKGLTF